MKSWMRNEAGYEAGSVFHAINLVYASIALGSCDGKLLSKRRIEVIQSFFRPCSEILRQSEKKVDF